MLSFSYNCSKIILKGYSTPNYLKFTVKKICVSLLHKVKSFDDKKGQYDALLSAICKMWSSCDAAGIEARQANPPPLPLVGTGFTRAEGESVGEERGFFFISKLQKSQII